MSFLLLFHSLSQFFSCYFSDGPSSQLTFSISLRLQTGYFFSSPVLLFYPRVSFFVLAFFIPWYLCATYLFCHPHITHPYFISSLVEFFCLCHLLWSFISLAMIYFNVFPVLLMYKYNILHNRPPLLKKKL